MKRKNVTKPTTIPSNQPGNAFGYVHLLGLVQWVCRLAVGRRERGRGSRGGEKREKKKKIVVYHVFGCTHTLSDLALRLQGALHFQIQEMHSSKRPYLIV